MKLSITIPVYNEEGNVRELHDRLTGALERDGYEFEIIFVNDRSIDGTEEILDEIGRQDKRVRVIHFSRNFGQTAAIMAGINHSDGDVIITMDGDLQNDPADIPRLMKEIDAGHDVVSGWRRNRKDSFLYRTLPSVIANWIISYISNVKLHDYGCTLKAYKKEVIKGTKLYGEMHRFVPIYASWQGAKVTEIEVTHHPRVSGESKYGITRTFRVILDLILVRFLDKYMHNPMHLFGGFGLLSFSAAVLASGAMIYYKFWGGKSFTATPLPTLTTLLVLMGFTSIMIGIVAEMTMRTYYESQDKQPYQIKRIVN